MNQVKTDKIKEKKIPLTFFEIILRLKIQKMEGDISPRDCNLLFKQDLVPMKNLVITG